MEPIPQYTKEQQLGFGESKVMYKFSTEQGVHAPELVLFEGPPYNK